jgi:ABC-2 type transport system permease protein
MLKDIFRKTLFEKRWITFWWSLITLTLVVAVTTMFPLFKDSLGNLTDVPEELKALVGDAGAYSTITGWLNLQVFDQMVFSGIILGIIVGGGILAGEENEGTLQSLLALPIKRGTAYLHKFAALTAMVGVISLCLFIGSWIGVVLIDEHIDAWQLFLCTLMAFLASLFFATLTYVVGAITGRRGIAGTAVGLFAFASFMITSLAAGISALKYVDYLSPFHYYNKPSPLIAGFQAWDALILTLVILALLAAGYRIFTRRDIYQR